MSIEQKRPEANTIFGGSAKEYANLYSGVTRGYRVSEGAVTTAIIPHIANLQKQGKEADVLELGAGTGQSTKRIEQIFKINKLTKIRLITSEYNRAMIQTGKNLNAQRAEKKEPEISSVPMIQATAEALPVRKERFDVVYGSQVLHWIVDIPKSFEEAHNALKPGGLIAHAGSGIIEGFKDSYFTEHPAYKFFLRNVEHELRDRKYWTDEKGEFTPENKLVNPFFHRYNFEDIENMLTKAGFVDVKRTRHSVPVNMKEMLLRMSAGATSMFIFGGEYAKKISAKEREEIVNASRNKIYRNKKVFESLRSLDQNPAHDDSVLFVAKKL